MTLPIIITKLELVNNAKIFCQFEPWVSMSLSVYMTEKSEINLKGMTIEIVLSK